MAELVLVTGGSGYVAGWCIAELLRRGYEVRTTVRDPGRERGVVDAVSSVAVPAGRLSFAVADLTADDGWEAAVKGARFLDRSLREITPALGRRNRHTNEKARRVLGWAPRPARETVLDCARSLIAHGVA